jgi:hypothetical protein
VVILPLWVEIYQNDEREIPGMIRERQEIISLTANIRECGRDDWQIEELTSAIIYEEIQAIQEMRKEWEFAKGKLAGLYGGRQGDFLNRDDSESEGRAGEPHQSQEQPSLFRRSG